MAKMTPEKLFVLRRLAALGNNGTVTVLGGLMGEGKSWQECETELRRKIFSRSRVVLPQKIKPEFWQNPIGKRVLDMVEEE